MNNLIRFDWAVKRLLRNKANFVILEGFLSELIGEDIKIDSVLESEGNRQTANNKTNRVDILVQNSFGELIIIELQNDYKQDYLMRMLYATSKLITDNLVMGMDYSKIKKVISVNIVYFDLGKGLDYVYKGTTKYVGLHKNDILTLSADEEKVYHTIDISKIYPEYYIIKVNQFNDVAKNTLDEWINFFKNEEVSADTKAKGLKEAMVELNVMKLSKEEKLEYESFIADWRDTYAGMAGNFNRGKNEGIREGKKEGIREGIIKVAKAMKDNKIDVQIIIKTTGLTEQEIEQL